MVGPRLSSRAGLFRFCSLNRVFNRTGVSSAPTGVHPTLRLARPDTRSVGIGP